MSMNAAGTAAPPGLARVLEVRGLRVEYRAARGSVIAVNGVDLDMWQGETLGLVGDSGSGKSTVAMAMLRLLQPPGRIVEGEVRIAGVDMRSLSERQLRQVLWKQVSLIPQGSMNSLNPIMRVKDQIADAVEAHEGRQARAVLRERIVRLLEMVRLPRRVYDLYPHELSGGMKQRVCIAMAIALSPPLIIADEPTSALDVVVQRVVARTLREVKQRLGVSMLLIGHDMALQAQMADRIAVMYAGNVVEVAPVRDLFADPLHPYTQRLIASIPTIKNRKPLVYTDDLQPDLRRPRQALPLQEVKPNHYVALPAARHGG
ncbi:MAG TPA: ABC transporter ATP-binding protein [Chloroflexota bacterium]|nr:ABC transporter ATP-binding protein [Chloroflexota bacterium]